MESAHVLPSIYRAIDELNLQLPPEKRLGKSTETDLYTRSGNLDSLGIVNLILMTEENLLQDFGVQVDLTSSLQSQNGNPFRSVSTLADHIARLL